MAGKIRVAVYARVSEESEQTRHSLMAQTMYYDRWICGNPDWELAGIYTDYGISGTGWKKRAEFQNMLADCEVGKVDRILVKSVSRFARNTLELLQIVRYLRRLGISVWFEEQKIDSMTEEGELMLTLMAGIAQAESESISENAKWAIRKAFQNGIGNTRRRTFGYHWMEGELTVIPAEAAVVRQIFVDFLAGESQGRIAEKLRKAGITSVHGNPISVRAIGTILRNITYTGNTLLQKTFIRDPISKKKMMNTGELPQYLVRDSHEALVDLDTFRRVQEKLAKNKEQGGFPYNRTGAVYPFTRRVICGCCGRHYTRQLWNTSRGGRKRPTWGCTGKKAEEYRRCKAGNLSEEKLMEASAAALGLLEFDEGEFCRRVASITVQDNRELLFSMKDGDDRQIGTDHIIPQSDIGSEKEHAAFYASVRSKAETGDIGSNQVADPYGGFCRKGAAEIFLDKLKKTL